MKHWWKWLLGILAFIVIIVSLGAWYLSKHWKPIIDLKLKEIVHNSTDGLYKLKYANMDVNVSFGNISLDKVELIPDSVVYSKLVLAQKAPNNQYKIKVDALKIRHFSLTDIFFNRKLTISDIVLQTPDVQVLYQYHAYNDTISSTEKKSFYDHIKGAFASISVSNIIIDSASFQYAKVDNGTVSTTKLNNLFVKIHDVLIDSTSLIDSSRLFYTKMIDVDAPGMTFDLAGGLYKVGFDKLHFNTKDKSAVISNVVYKPKLNRAAFFRKVNQNVTMNDVRFEKVRINGFDFKRLLNDKAFFGSSIVVSNGNANFYQDMRYPSFPVNMVGKDPYQQLMKIKAIYHFDTVYVDNVSVSYSEFSARYEKLGTITFTHAKGTLTNVTNDKILLQKNKFMRANLNAKVMDIGNINVRFGFDMLSKHGYYTYAGTVSPMPATAFNRILVPLVNVEISTGDIKKISFNMEGTNYKNWGTFNFDYTDLKVGILGTAKDGKTDKTKKTASFIVNKMLINNSNPDAKGKHNVGIVNYTRVPEYPFFKTIWKSLLQGIVQCAGISREREAKLMSLAETSTKAISTANKVIKGVDSVAKSVGKTVGKDAKKVAHETDVLFKKVFKKKKKEDKEEEE